jgi:hypothetical protein
MIGMSPMRVDALSMPVAANRMLKVNNNENKKRKVLRLIAIFDKKTRFL